MVPVSSLLQDKSLRPFSMLSKFYKTVLRLIEKQTQMAVALRRMAYTNSCTLPSTALTLTTQRRVVTATLAKLSPPPSRVSATKRRVERRYARAVSRWSCWWGVGGGGVTRVVRVDKVKGNRFAPPTLTKLGWKDPHHWMRDISSLCLLSSLWSDCFLSEIAYRLEILCKIIFNLWKKYRDKKREGGVKGGRDPTLSQQ